MENKSPFKSKTLWVALIIAICGFFPPVAEFIKLNPEMFGMVVAGIFSVLRVITKGKLVIE